MEVKVFNFSGGESSALQTILGKPGPNDIVLFADAKREVPRTYDFINEFEQNEGIKVHRAVFTHKNAPGLEGYAAYVKAYEKQYLPNVSTRGCTRELKIRTAKRYLKLLGIKKFTQFIGFRSEEQDRILKYKDRFKNVKTRFLLNELGIDDVAVNAYWSMKSYRLGLPKIMKNCNLCFLKGKDNIITLMQHHPEFADQWINDEKPGSTYIKGITYKHLKEIADLRTSLGIIKPLEVLEPAFNCSCSAF
jgi:hypothetical protein